MSLALLVEEHNMMARFFKEQTTWSATDIDQAMADAMFKRLDSNLSPEVLFADGERPRSKAMALKKRYEKAIAELKAKGFRPSRSVTIYNFEV